MSKTKAIFFKFALAATLLLTAPALFAQQTKQPNIIFILVDDLGYGDLGAFFQNQRKQNGDKSEPWLLTPQLDQMAYQGAMLTEHYCAAPVCAPSRASLLTGLSQGHANVRDNQFDKALEDNYTLGNVMQLSGYSTAAIGKWGLQGKSKAPNWPAHPLKRGFDYYYGYIAHGDGHEHYPKEGLYRKPKKVWENYSEVSDQLDKCYTGDLFTAVAKKYIIDHQKGKESKKPFFMYLAYDTPHAVLELPTQKYPEGGGLNGGLQWLGKSGHMINTASGDIDSYVYPEYKNATYDHDKNPATAEIAWPDTYKRYASVTHRIDDQVGDLLQLLKDLKIDQNTLVVFSSDNGPSQESYLPKEYVSYEADFFNNFGPFDGIKRDCYDGGLRTATIARWPGTIPPGTIVTSPSISYDWLPTFVNAAGSAAPVRCDGVSLLPALTGKGKQEKSLVYAEYFFPGKSPDYPEFAPEHRAKRRQQMQMIRMGDTVAVRYDIQSFQDDFEIYHIKTDPQQAKNIAAASIALQAALKERVLQIRMADSTAPRPYDHQLIPAASPRMKLRKGMAVTGYKCQTPWIPHTEGLKPVYRGMAAAFDLSKVGQPLAKFHGFIYVEKAGAYTFSLASGNKSFFKVHDIKAIDADYGTPSLSEKTVTLQLAKGYHPFELYSLAAKSGAAKDIKLQWSFNGGAFSPVASHVYIN
ncbi:sulfatase-like hydrolase/transferase [Niabella insulamsoli]|uniref:sulfatase-like hydrolase/transferase n=1 Tax=Niabella insulamsoli TaxID=3144874 RepID=UPI0031FD59CD